MASGPRLVKSRLKQDKNILESRAVWWPGIPALKVSRDSTVVSSSGSWFHSLMLDGKKDSLYVLFLKYGTLYLYWWPLVATPNSWRCGEAGIATMACTTRNIIMALACCLLY